MILYIQLYCTDKAIYWPLSQKVFRWLTAGPGSRFVVAGHIYYKITISAENKDNVINKNYKGMIISFSFSPKTQRPPKSRSTNSKYVYVFYVVGARAVLIIACKVYYYIVRNYFILTFDPGPWNSQWNCCHLYIYTCNKDGDIYYLFQQTIHVETTTVDVRTCA